MLQYCYGEAMPERKATKEPASRKEAQKARHDASRPSYKAIYAAIIIIIAAAIIFVLVFPQYGGNDVPFSTFKSTLSSAPRVGLVVSSSNATQSGYETPCYTSIIQVLAHSRKASTIDFFIINASNSTCTYSSTGLGGSVALATSNASYCIGVASSEPSIFLNYSQSNSIAISPARMYVYGNSEYMASCPIAIDLG